jgi:hypothetical protein
VNERDNKKWSVVERMFEIARAEQGEPARFSALTPHISADFQLKVIHHPRFSPETLYSALKRMPGRSPR